MKKLNALTELDAKALYLALFSFPIPEGRQKLILEECYKTLEKEDIFQGINKKSLVRALAIDLPRSLSISFDLYFEALKFRKTSN